MMKGLMIVTAGAMAAIAVSATTAFAQDVDAGQHQFNKCLPCHAVGPDAENKIGPELNGLDGRHSGTAPNYSYSDANKNSGIVWTPDELDKYLTSPQTVVPHTKMIFPGLKDEQKRRDVIAYLQQFGPDGQKKQ